MTMISEMLLASSGNAIAADIRRFVAPLAAIIIAVMGLRYLFGDHRSLGGFFGFLILGVVVYSLIQWGDTILQSLGGIFRAWVEPGTEEAFGVNLPVVLVAAVLAIVLWFVIAVMVRGGGRGATDEAPPTDAADRTDEVEAPSRERYTELALAALEGLAPAGAGPDDADRWRGQVRLAVVVAVERHVFGGDSPVTPAHLAKWVVLGDMWPEVVDRLWTEHDFIRSLETTPSAEVDDDGIVRFLATGPRLSPVVQSLLHMVALVEPGSD